jgi:hypothetical protein
MTPFLLFCSCDQTPTIVCRKRSSRYPQQHPHKQTHLSMVCPLPCRTHPRTLRLTILGQTQEFLQAARPQEGMRPSQSQTMKHAQSLTQPQREGLDTKFKCVFCNSEDSISTKIDKKAGVASLSCKNCVQSYQMSANCTLRFPCSLLRTHD